MQEILCRSERLVGYAVVFAPVGLDALKRDGIDLIPPFQTVAAPAKGVRRFRR